MLLAIAAIAALIVVLVLAYLAVGSIQSSTSTDEEDSSLSSREKEITDPSIPQDDLDALHENASRDQLASKKAETVLDNIPESGMAILPAPPADVVDGLAVEQDFRCGPSFKTRCRPGYFCSQWGWCGQTQQHATGAQTTYNGVGAKVAEQPPTLALPAVKEYEIGVVRNGVLQQGWRFCNKCGLMRIALAGKTCPAGGIHSGTSSGYVVPIAQLANTQVGWRFCRTCSCLVWKDTVRGCVNGQSHDFTLEGAIYSVFIGKPDATSNDTKDLLSQSGWRWCNSCGGLGFGDTPGKCFGTGAAHTYGTTQYYAAMLSNTLYTD